MGQFFSEQSPSSKEVKMVFIGLDTSGKTSILYKIQNKNEHAVRTIGFNQEIINYKNIKFTTFDLGGQIQHMWSAYYQSMNAIVFVVDSNDRARFNAAYEALRSAVQDDNLRDCKVLIFANKQDLGGAANVSDIVTALHLQDIRQEWHVQPCCALSGVGLTEGFDWLYLKFNEFNK